MPSLHVQINVPPDVAIRDGVTTFGREWIPLTDLRLGELAACEREWLGRSGALGDLVTPDEAVRPIDLPSSARDWLSVREVIRTRAAVERERIEQATKAAALAAEALARQDAADVALREYARQMPALARGATEGYDVRNAVMDHIAKEVARFGVSDAGPDTSSVILTQGTSEFEKCVIEDRTSPHPPAFVALDLIRGRVDALRGRFPSAPSVTITVGRIIRFRSAPADASGRSRPYTAIIVHITCLVANDRMVVFRVE